MHRIILLVLMLFSFQLNAAIMVNGYFDATKNCPAYLSKNKKSNPQQLTVHPGQHYLVREINRPSPDWLRVEMPGNQPALRWVNAQCGEFHYQYQQIKDCEIRAGLADAHVLALSWQPGFCQTYGYEAGKPECLNLSDTSYSSHHLSLHGLWPNQTACGSNYGFCGISPKKYHCAYPPLELNDEVSNALKKFMPAYAQGSCLERHEWNKHGRCQLLSSDDYFSLAMRLLSEVDASDFGQFLTSHRGQRIEKDRIKESFRQAFGHSASQKIYLACKTGMLVDIFIHLPALIPQQEPLVNLLNNAADFERNDRCPRQVLISDFHGQAIRVANHPEQQH